MSDVKRVIFLRHAKSDWNADYGSDHSRPINERGRASAEAIGRAIRDIGQIPDLVITSSAVRAKTTVQLAAETGKWACPINETDELYEAAPGSVLTLISETHPSVERLMLVGHEPTWSTTVSLLIGGGNIAMKTATAAAIDVTSWTSIGPGYGSLAWMLNPRLFLD